MYHDYAVKATKDREKDKKKKKSILEAAMFGQAAAGDTVIVLEVSRLARSTQQLWNSLSVCDISRTTAYKYKSLLEA